MKKYLLFSLLILSVSLFAAERTSVEALRIADDFFASRSVTATRSATPITLAATSNQLLSAKKMQAYDAQPAFYVFNKGGNAFVIISGDDEMQPVLGYSLNREFSIDNLPANMLYWLETYQREYHFMRTTPVTEAYQAPLKVSTRSYPESVSPLLGEIMWDQSAPYNDLCPEYNGTRSVTGCVATAMAQVMRYHKYPAKGKGSNSYTSQTLALAASFDFASTTFDWDNMLPQYVSGSYTDDQAKAVATLMYACGVSVDMDYTPDDSGAMPYAAAEALINNFEYSSNIRFLQRDYYQYAEWMDLIKTEISNSRPIMYDGQSTEGGHEFVFDGYDENDMVHVNWGWSGVNDGYFAISALAPSSLGIGGGTNLGGGFSSDQGMIIGIQPSSEGTSYVSNFYVSELTPSATTITLGETTNFTFTDLYNMSTDFPGGEIAIIAELNDGQTVLATKEASAISASAGYTSYSFNSVTFPASLQTGTYLIYAATKATGEASWSRVRGFMGAATQYYATVSNGAATLSNYWGKIELGATVDIKHNLYCSLIGNFALTLDNTNAEQEYFGQVGIGFISDNSLVSVFNPLQVYMSAGESGLALALSDTLSSAVTAGTYDVYPVAQWGDEYYLIGDAQSVTVSANPGVGTLSVNSFAVAQSEVSYGSDVVVTATMGVSGTSSIYSGTVAVIVFDSTGEDEQGVFLNNLFIDQSDYNFSYSFNPSLAVGDYMLALYETSTSPYTQMTDGVSFSIVDPTGIEDDAVDGSSQLIVYPTPAEGFINIILPAGAERIKVFDMQGAMLIDESVAIGATQQILNIAGLPAGSYLLNVQLGNKALNQKFIKK